MKISKQLNVNIKELEKQFMNCNDIIHRPLIAAGLTIYVVYVDSLIDRNLVEAEFLRNMMYGVGKIPDTNVFEFIQKQVLTTADTKAVDNTEDAILEVLSGNTALFISGCSQALVISSRKYPGRGVQSAESEVSVRGPKDSFTESMRINTLLVRRRIRDTRLKTIQRKVGVRSRTDITIMYMDGIARPEIVREIEERLQSFEIDGFLTAVNWNS